jgi:hypothetical protein
MEKNLNHSADPVEESYRDRLRAIEARRERIERRRRERGIEGSAASETPALAASSSSSTESVLYGQTSSKPTRLPKSGMEWGGISMLMAAGYCCVLHARARRRVG